MSRGTPRGRFASRLTWSKMAALGRARSVLSVLKSSDFRRREWAGDRHARNGINDFPITPLSNPLDSFGALCYDLKQFDTVANCCIVVIRSH